MYLEGGGETSWDEVGKWGGEIIGGWDNLDGGLVLFIVGIEH